MEGRNHYYWMIQKLLDQYIFYPLKIFFSKNIKFDIQLKLEIIPLEKRK
jgi:hypothetical protein